MKRIAGAVLLALLAACAQAQVQVPTIVLVLPRAEGDIEAGFRDYLAQRGLRARIETLRWSSRAEEAPALVAQVRKLAPDLVYTAGTTTTLALAGSYDSERQDFIRDVPIVFVEVADPVGTRLVKQLDPSGRNVTGVTHVAPLATQLGALAGWRPFTRIGYIANPKEFGTQIVLEALRKLGVTMRFEVIDEKVPLDAAGNPDAAALPQLVRRIAEQKPDFLYVAPSTFLAVTHRDLLTQAAVDAKLPTFCVTETIVRRSKCMFGLFASGTNLGRFAGYKAAQILAAKVPVEKVPVQTLQRFSLLINMPVARALQVWPPLPLLDAAEVIEK